MSLLLAGLPVPTKPPAMVRPESREPKSIRFTPSEWALIETAARSRGVEPSRFARSLCITGLSMLHAQAAMEAATRGTPYDAVGRTV